MYGFRKTLGVILSILFIFSIFGGSVVSGESIANSSVQDEDNKTILIKFKDDSKSEQTKNSIKEKLRLSKLNTKKKIESTKIEVLEVDNQVDLNGLVTELRKDSNIEYAQPDYKLHIDPINPIIFPQDMFFDYQWGLYNHGQNIGQEGTPGIDINVLPAWNITLGSNNIIVGVLDTGIDTNHIELKNNVFVNTSEIPQNGVDDDNNGYVDDVNGWDFANSDNSVFDNVNQDAHGTHVAGIIASDNDKVGIRGVAPNIRILPLKFITGNYGNTSDAIEAIQYAEKLGVSIINCSWSGYEYNYALKDAIENSNILFVCSSGNDGIDLSSRKIYPACFNMKNLISVAAIDNKGGLASFSNFGEDICVAAPGVNIVSTVPGNQYMYASGTSMAAPFVTGVAALLLSAKPKMSSWQIHHEIEKYATFDVKLDGKVSSKGIVNAYHTLVKDKR